MGLEDVGKVDLVVLDAHNTHDTGIIADSSDSSTVQVGTFHQVNTAGLAVELALGHSLATEVVPDLDVTILTHGDTHVEGITDRHGVNAARVEVDNDIGLKSLTVKLPDATLEVLDQPHTIALNHVHNVGSIPRFSLDLNLLDWLDGDLWNLISLSSIDLLE